VPRHVESGVPGESLCADTFFVGNLKDVGMVYLHAVVDTYGSYSFSFLHVSKQPEAGAGAAAHHVMSRAIVKRTTNEPKTMTLMVKRFVFIFCRPFQATERIRIKKLHRTKPKRDAQGRKNAGRNAAPKKIYSRRS
jgi:hypothetical protein